MCFYDAWCKVPPHSASNWRRPTEAESIPADFAGLSSGSPPGRMVNPAPNVEARYRVLLDQIPAVVFMAYLDRGNRRSLREPADRKDAGVLAARMAGGSGSLVSADPSRR